ncbi:hypothetical protein BGW38_003566 [Lunasporangiospora selenospora]|uniref:Uncharacterized protein n=1 Tax=Lunasporangiospora selenospora TaxID=979761 RepID=A0A9P6KHK5_9FUNG|nr:hypothetical protein BGW38_003566 [Lunasporangiospora selenospora]
MDNTVDSKIDRGKILWRSERSKPSVFCLIDPTNSNNKRMFVAPRWDQNEGSNIKQTSTLWQEYNSIYDMPYSRGTKCYTMPALDSCSDLQDGEKLGSYLNSIYGELNVSSRDCRVAYYDFFY